VADACALAGVPVAPTGAVNATGTAPDVILTANPESIPEDMRRRAKADARDLKRDLDYMFGRSNRPSARPAAGPLEWQDSGDWSESLDDRRLAALDQIARLLHFDPSRDPCELAGEVLTLVNRTTRPAAGPVDDERAEAMESGRFDMTCGEEYHFERGWNAGYARGKSATSLTPGLVRAAEECDREVRELRAGLEAAIARGEERHPDWSVRGPAWQGRIAGLVDMASDLREIASAPPAAPSPGEGEVERLAARAYNEYCRIVDDPAGDDPSISWGLLAPTTQKAWAAAVRAILSAAAGRR
jgi:hypothetical protein